MDNEEGLRMKADGTVWMQVWSGPPMWQRPAAPSLLGRRKAAFATWPSCPSVLSSACDTRPEMLCPLCVIQNELRIQGLLEGLYLLSSWGRLGIRQHLLAVANQTLSRLPQSLLFCFPLWPASLAAPDVWILKTPSAWFPHSFMCLFCDLGPTSESLSQPSLLYFYSLCF